MSESLNIVKVLSRTHYGTDRTTLLKLYRSLVRSKLDYDCIIYGSASKTSLAKLDLIHNQGLHPSFRAFRSLPVEGLYVEADEPTLEIRWNKVSSVAYHQIESQPGKSSWWCSVLLQPPGSIHKKISGHRFLKSKANPKNPAYDVFSPKHQGLYKRK